MKRKPTLKRPDTASAVRNLMRVERGTQRTLRQQTAAIDRQTNAIHLLRLDVQSMRYGNGAAVAAIDRLRAAIEARAPLPYVPTVSVAPWDAPSPVEADMEQQIMGRVGPI